MIAALGFLAYGCLGLATVALIWAIRELERTADVPSQWQPGTKPHNWRV